MKAEIQSREGNATWYNITPEIGHVQVLRFGANHPHGKPFFCDGQFFCTEREAIDSFVRRASAPRTPGMLLAIRDVDCNPAELRCE
jgi:hypothetical protein